MSDTIFLTTEQLLKHWQGHRGLTRRVIEAFPEEAIDSFTLGGMRTFGDLMAELLRMSVPMLEGAATGTWTDPGPRKAASKAELLAAWDEDTAAIEALWPRLTPDRLNVHDVAFGMYEGRNYDNLRYIIDNEIHHRGQAYVYLRALGIEPPAFYEREF